MPRPTGSRNQFPAKKRGRPVGSGDPFKKAGSIHEVLKNLYGTSAYKISAVRKAHIDKGCHMCMKEAEDRLYGKASQEVKYTGKNLQPIILVSVNDRPIIGQQAQLEEGAEEAVFDEVEEEDAAEAVDS